MKSYMLYLEINFDFDLYIFFYIIMFYFLMFFYFLLFKNLREELFVLVYENELFKCKL